ncbi:response regulator [Paenibacillus psychroresistens]|uniref:Response regulator n=1 Tax=Paenibacillus psychroresistens TaxID=1778678 RepID=A0A6B8RHY7_9BACL|nr:response regulator [Paenibacillus psychroresistens]QGQ96071.1 response regulator [Paenibacillus psychroresistens]
MYKLLIVDDEKLILDGLTDLFMEDELLNLTIFKASSAIEALTIFEQKKIDILLTDIRMPKMSGLELVEQLKGRWPECRVIFLTGYHEFDYIYQAIQQGQVKYVLKTEGDAKIFAAVQETVDELEASLKMESLLKKAILLRRQQSAYHRSLFFADLMEEVISSEQFRKHSFDELEIPLDVHNPLLLVAARIDNDGARMKGYERDRIFSSLTSICDRYFAPLIRFVDFVDNRTYLFLFIQALESSHMSWERLNTFVHGSLETIQRTANQTLGLPISFAMMNHPTEWDLIAKDSSLLKALLFQYNNEKQIIITEKNDIDMLKTFQDTHMKSITAVFHKKAERLDIYLETGKKDEIFRLFTELEAIIKHCEMNDSQSIELYYSVSFRLLVNLNKYRLQDSMYYKENIRYLTQSNVHSSWDSAIKFLREMVRGFFEVQSDKAFKIKGDVVGKIKLYIAEHLADDLSLTNLADQVYLNPEYLSRLFKQSEGMTITEYITELKIRKAKELLSQPELYIQDIAKSMGFSTAGYFTRFFKKETDLTPQEFRTK